MKKVLFLCTGNSARSIISECLMNQMGEGKYRAHSAGSKPTGTVNPFSIQVLKKNNINYENTLFKHYTICIVTILRCNYHLNCIKKNL